MPSRHAGPRVKPRDRRPGDKARRGRAAYAPAEAGGERAQRHAPRVGSMHCFHVARAPRGRHGRSIVRDSMVRQVLAGGVSQDEATAQHANEARVSDLSKLVIGCALAVASTLRSGLVEKVCANALVCELRKRGVAVVQQGGVAFASAKLLQHRHSMFARFLSMFQYTKTGKVSSPVRSACGTARGCDVSSSELPGSVACASAARPHRWQAVASVSLARLRRRPPPSP